MSLITLTKDLVNFKWTNYDNVGDNLSQTGGRHGGTLPGGQPPHSTDHSEFDDGAGTPQSFYDGHSKIVTGQKTFERPNPKSLDQMVSKFGPLNTQPNDRGPYGVSDFMDGTKQGRGFTPPGGHPLGFTVDMGVSEYVIGTTGYTLTPLSHTIAGITSNGPHGSVPEHTIDIQFGTSWSNPEAVNAWAEDFMTTPLANYVSQYSEPVDSLTHEVTMIALTGPTAPDDYQTNINVTPKVDNAHGSDFMTLPISGYPGLYVGSQGDIVPIIPSVIGLGESDSIAATWPDKIFHQLGNLQDEKLYDVYKHHFLPTIENFNHISLLTDLFENESTSVAAEKWKDGSVHIGTQDWAAPVGGGVTSWANLMAVTPRYSMFRDAQGNYQVPTLFPHEWVNQPTFNVLGGYPESTYGEGYTINSQFGFSWNNIAGWFMASDGGVATNYSSQHGAHSFEIGDINIDLYESMPLYHLDTPLTIKWHSIGEHTAGLWPYKQFGFSRGGFEEGFLDIETSTGALVYATQPFIRRQVGQGYLDGRSTWVVGVDHLATVIARIEEDTMRISSWLNTPAGKNWTGNQYTLQELNPRPETRIYNPLSLITSLVPHFHGQRHLSGFFGLFGPGKYGDLQTDMDYQEEGPGWDGKDTAGIWGYGTREAGSFAIGEKNRLTGLTAQFIGGAKPEEWKHLWNTFPSWDGGFWSAISGMEDWSATNRGRTPEKPTQVVFSQRGAYGKGDVHSTIPMAMTPSRSGPPEPGKRHDAMSLSEYYADMGYPQDWALHLTGHRISNSLDMAYTTLSYNRLDFLLGAYSPDLNAFPHSTGYTSDILQHNWRFWPGTAHEKSKYWADETPMGDNEAAVKEHLESRVFTLGDSSYSINNFLGTFDDDTAAAKTVETKMINHSIYQSGGLASKIGWSGNQPLYTVRGGAPKGAPTTSPDYFTVQYQGLGHPDSINAYGLRSSSVLNWTKWQNIGTSSAGDSIYFPFSGIIGYSWKFWDPENKNLASYIGKPNIKTIQELELSDLKDNTFTISDKVAKGIDSSGNLSEDLLKRYSTLAYGNLNLQSAYDSNKDGRGALLSPSEFNMTDPKKISAFTEEMEERKIGWDISKDIGEAGTPNIGPLTDTALGVIKKGIDGEKHVSVTTDKVNMIPYGKKDYTAKDFGDTTKKTSDFIKFKFYDVINNRFIIFRALLSGISDSITPEWTGTRYIGRPDQVYVYQGAERKINFSFDVYPKTKQELPVLWEKLNYLVGLCYPSYKENRMVAPFINLTIGDMFVETPGFLDSLSIEVNDMSTWEIQDGLQFPKHITCQCSFTYIGKHLQTGGPLGKHYGIMDKTPVSNVKLDSTIDPPAEIVPLTFGQVFNNARNKENMEKTFTWNGMLYNTMTEEEKAGGKVFWNGTSWGEPASQGADESTDWGPAQGM